MKRGIRVAFVLVLFTTLIFTHLSSATNHALAADSSSTADYTSPPLWA